MLRKPSEDVICAFSFFVPFDFAFRPSSSLSVSVGILNISLIVRGMENKPFSCRYRELYER